MSTDSSKYWKKKKKKVQAFQKKQRKLAGATGSGEETARGTKSPFYPHRLTD